MTATVIEHAVVTRKPWQTPYALWVSVTDACVVTGAVLLAQYIRFGHTSFPEGDWSTRLTGYSILFALLWLLSLMVFHTRSHRLLGHGFEEYQHVVSASFWTFGIIAIASLLLKLEIARGYLAVALPTGTLGLLLSRHLWRNHLARERARGGCQTYVVAIGDLRAVSLLARELMGAPRSGYQIVGVGIPGYGAPRGEAIIAGDIRIPILGDAVHALDAIDACGADTVAITDTEHFGGESIRQLLWRLDGRDIDVVVSPGVFDIAAQRLVMRPVSGYPLIHVEKPQYQGAKRFQQRAFDFCFALAALIGTSPLLFCAAIAIKLTSRGPVFYAAERIGRDGRPFTMLKLRTMTVAADARRAALLATDDCPGVLFKMYDDPRITTVGRFLRRFSIDELPEFINVLKQQMSVVGPRPPLRCEVDMYDGEVKHRLLARPGITGLWQVSGRSDLTWEQSVRLDLYYVENWSMVGDLVIILKTLRAVLCRPGAY